MERLINRITQFDDFTQAELAVIASRFQHRTFKAKAYLLRDGQTANQLHFIVAGLVRVFYLKEGKEITTYLACDDGFVSSYASFMNQTRSFECIQCLEDTETLSIDFKGMQELYACMPQWQKIGRILAEHTVVCLTDRLLKIHAVPARAKYIDFLENAPPKIVQRTPLIHIASFLGITPESLSRIRREIS